jgi:cytochrome c peroxidase
LKIQHVFAAAAATVLGAGCVDTEIEPQLEQEEQPILVEELLDKLPNNFPLPADHGLAASFHPAGSVALDNEFFTAQGTNGRNCGTCHAPEDGWSLRPATVQLMFLFTGGQHPLFVNNLDTDKPTCDMSTFQSRWNCTTMLRQGLFTRRVNVPATRDYDVIAANDPFGVGTTSTLWFFRRPLPTANFRSHTVMWDGANTVGTNLRDGLLRQAAGNVTGAQQGQPATPEVVAAMVDYEMAITHAQTHVFGVGSLTAAGARGGPEEHADEPLENARFDLFDAWQDSHNAKRRQIWRGQELFNNQNVASGRTCRGCHNARNNGQNVNGTLFDVGASRPEFNPGRAVYTFQRRSDGATVQTTDPGRGIRSGNFADLNRFKTPNIRGLASRAPYFHGGHAKDLKAVVTHYEVALGFVFTAQEEDDLVAFMGAL